VISVDDHVVEPPDLFDGRVPARFAGAAPRIVETELGHQVWRFEEQTFTQVGMNHVGPSVAANPLRPRELLVACGVSATPNPWISTRPGCAHESAIADHFAKRDPERAIHRRTVLGRLKTLVETGVRCLNQPEMDSKSPSVSRAAAASRAYYSVGRASGTDRGVRIFQYERTDSGGEWSARTVLWRRDGEGHESRPVWCSRRQICSKEAS
jgi:hypothetical protein